MINPKLPLLACFALSLVACGGGGSDSGGGAQKSSNRCSITDVTVSSGTSATLSKASSRLSASATLTLDSAQTVRVISNFESVAADDWIEGIDFSRNFPAGPSRISINYDLNSPMKGVADRYSKLTIIAELPGDEACVTTLPVNIALNP